MSAASIRVANTNRNAYNEALAYHKKHALTGEYPNISLDYPKALLSIGTLIPANNPSSCPAKLEKEKMDRRFRTVYMRAPLLKKKNKKAPDIGLSLSPLFFVL
ncbi:hypothetical protein AQ505_02320 [Pedobacter sp. PACM 27299]|nr:hypothetical protein AQ505_02320 [Pedobacter sp. PACM 27299]